MTYKETGFRPFYHQISALEQNEKLRALIKNSPDAAQNNESADLEDETVQNKAMEIFQDGQDVKMAVGKMDVFNYALYLNNVPPVRDIYLLNETQDPVEGLSLHIASDFDFFKEYEMQLPPVPSGKPVKVDDPLLLINGKELAGLTESVKAHITVELLRNGKAICSVQEQMLILAYDQWHGDSSYRDLLPAFVLPNHPVVSALLHDTADRLKKWKKPVSLEGYQMEDPNRVRDLAAAAYAAIQKKNIVYAEPPASFSIIGQRIRTPETILEQRLGTCMDMTLLYAAVLEAIGLHPLLVMKKHHIYAGIWLKDRSVEELQSGQLIIENPDELRKRIGTGTDELTFVECTSMCSGKQVSFEQAELNAKTVTLVDIGNFEYAIDVALSRIMGIKPVPARVKDSGEYQIRIEEIRESDVTAAPKNLGISIAQMPAAAPKKISGKKELWESKLLDLSRRNMLLNLPLNKSVMPIMSSHVDELEDSLADGHEFHLLPAADWITGLQYSVTSPDGKKGKPVYWLAEAIRERGIFEVTRWPADANFDLNEKFRQEFRSHRLYTFSSEKQLSRELTTIYRAARSSQQENGVSSLYLAIGLLRWFADPESDDPSYAPLILLPVEIIRKSANQGYALHARDEEPHFNTTLLEMLRQNYNLEIPGVDPLPTDDHGIDIKKAFAIVRGSLYSLKNWDVVESCAIGNFSFAQFAMWNDIHTAGDLLENSKLVRSLIKGHIDWEIPSQNRLSSTAADANSAGSLSAGILSPDGTDGGGQIYLPITVDGTQLQAVKMAAQGNTFILHGPPGTGKSQTITAIIANLMAQGKKVLFVAEKMAALSVVQKRLSALGIGDFCLELHSDKANKKQILSQLERALAVRQPSRRSEYETRRKEAEQGRKKLDGYAQHLHAVRNSGYSLRDLIDLYETVRDVEKYVRVDRGFSGRLSKNELQHHVPLLGQLTAAGEAVGDIQHNVLLQAGVGLTSYGTDVRSSLRRSAEAYLAALNEIESAGTAAADLLQMKTPESRKDYIELIQLVQMYFEKTSAEPELFRLLESSREEVRDFLEKDAALKPGTDIMQRIWREPFLGMDMNSYMQKYDSAGKKIFGKASAINAVLGEIQSYALRPITYEEIPPLLRAVSAWQTRKQELETARSNLTDAGKKLLSQCPTIQSLEEAGRACERYRRQAAEFPGGPVLLRTLVNRPETAEQFEHYRRSYQNLLETETQFNHLLVRRRTFRPRNTGNLQRQKPPVPAAQAENWVETERALCRYILEHPASLKDFSIYNQIRGRCMSAGLKPAVEAYENGLAAAEVIPAYRKGLYYALITDAINKDDVLSSFSGVTFNETIRQFKRIDDTLLEQAKKEIYNQLASQIPTSWGSPKIGSELNLLRKAISSNARGMSIRALFDRIPHVLQALCPCMLMSPNSVAQYLAQDNGLFDIVIFDEASQLPTCKAVGALFRAKDAVIVGDPKQMPPTSFFAGSGPVVDDLALDDLDSILDDALALGIPSQHLQWHYRSTHESLIAFSNNKFYENKMFTFPSANDRERHVTAIHVEGTYKSGTNVKEAEAVVAEIIRRFHDPEQRNQSVGVVTFNVKQQALIENLLAKQFQTNPALDAWANGGEDPLFIKNLENVQGDERDVILFSIGYGPDEKGRISMNFGPINQTGGGKRLNVAFSRSRVEMIIFSSIYSSDIRATENSPEGLIAFRDFLKYAEGGGLPAEELSGQEEITKAGILQSICRELSNHGFQYETMIGQSDFHIDIAVVDPYEPAKYLMGILLDGEGYRRSTNTRDREVAQIDVLRTLGWTLHRIWSIDWWDDRERVLEKLMTTLEPLRLEAEKRDAARQAAKAERQLETEKAALENERIQRELEKQAEELLTDEQEEEGTAGIFADQADTQKAAPTVIVSPAHTDLQESGPDQDHSSDHLEAISVEDPASAAQESVSSEGFSSEDHETVPPEGFSSGDQDTAPAAASPVHIEPAQTVQIPALSVASLLTQLQEADAEIVDKRYNGGALWIIGGENIRPIIKQFSALGIHFAFKSGGGKATGGKDGWWAKTDVVLPADQVDQTDPTDQTDKTDPTDQTDKTNPAEQADKTSGSDAADAAKNIAVTGVDDAVVPVLTSPVNTESVPLNGERTLEMPFGPALRPVPYVFADLPDLKCSSKEFSAAENKEEIQKRALAVLQAEAPILRDTLLKRIWSSFGVNKSTSVVEATEKALKPLKIKTTRQKGIAFCWAPDQDPKAYYEFRLSDDRTIDDYCQQELRNVICYTLQEKGELSKEDLIKETSLILGYKRLGKNLEAALAGGVQYAKNSGAIKSIPGKKFCIS